MSDQRRNSLTSIGANKKEKKSRDSSRTERFTLPLPESNEEACPEFNYRVLLTLAEKKRKNKLKDGYVNGVDPLGGGGGGGGDDDDDKLKEIARQFEEKYGGSRKKHGRYEDYVDLGAGYDENDPFIDNTDAYDEVVPEEMTTAHGGFYINCGALEFKEVSYPSDVEDLKDLKIRKRLKKTKLPDKRNADLIKKRKFVSHDREILKKKKRRAIDDLVKKKAVTVKELLREKRESLEVSSASDGKDVQEQKKNIVNSVPKPVSTSIVDVIESVVSAARGGEESSKDSSSVVSKSGSASAVSTDTEENRDAEVEEEKEKNSPKEEVKLPDNLSEDIKDLVRSLIMAAKTSAEGKCKFFSQEVNTMLLNVEQKCQPLACNSRQMVYGYLASYLPCTKDTLMKRAKKLVLMAEEGKIKEPLRKLRDAINAIMPPLIEKFQRDCQKVAEEKNVEESRSSVSDNEGNSENKTPSRNPKIPRRIFPWTNELRELLCEVVRIKLQYADIKKSRKETSEEILRNFLEKEVKPLWPPGWMKVATLLKESRDARTNTLAKPKKTNTIKKQSPTVSAMSGPAAGVPNPASSQLQPTSAGVINLAVRVQKSVPTPSPAVNSSSSVPVVPVAKSQLPSAIKPKLPTSEVTFNTTPRTKASPILSSNTSARVHSPSNGVTISISPSVSNGSVLVSPISSVGKPSQSIPVHSVKSKLGDISVKTTSPSGKNSPTISLDKQLASGVSVTKVKNSLEKVPAKSLDLSLSGSNKSISNAVPCVSSKVKSSSSVSIIPVTFSSSSSSQKSPVAALPLINIPDCISVTPSIPSPVSSTNISVTPKPMSLKQRILHDTAKERSNSSSNVNILSSAKKLEDEEGIEVIEIVGEKMRIDAGNMKQRNSGTEVPAKLKTEFKKKRKMECNKDIDIPAVITPLSEIRKPVTPSVSDKDAEQKLNEETAAATDLLSQIINESLDLPNSSSREVYSIEDKPASQTHRSVIQKTVSPPPPTPPVDSIQKESKSDSSVKEDSELESKSKCDLPQADDSEESVQLEMDRVMKELRELQGHMRCEKESDLSRVKYSPPNISSSVSVAPVNNVANVRSQHQVKTSKEPEVTCKPVIQARRTSLGTGFQEEFQKHLFQDLPREVEPVNFKLGKNKAVYPISSVGKDGVNTSEESPSRGHGSVISSTQLGNRSNSNPASLFPKYTSAAINSTTANPCDRRFPLNASSSSLHIQDQIKSNAYNSQAGSSQHSPPY